MAITLSRLFANSEKNYNIKLIAGQRGMKNLVRWVHMVEDSEVPGFLHGNELILTTGIAQKEPNWVVLFVESLRKHGAIGLIINIGPYIKQVPKSVIDYCDEHEFPLFVVPWEVHLIDVTFDFCHRIIANEENETGIVAAFHNLIFSPENKHNYVGALERRGFHNNGEYTLMILQATKDNTLISGDEWHNIQFSMHSALKNVERPICIFDQENYLVIVGSGVKASQMENYANILNSELLLQFQNIVVHAGISDTILGYAEMQSCYKQAVTASNTAKLQGKQILKYQSTGIYKLIFAIEDENVRNRYVIDTINQICEYDTIHNTDYLSTLKYYLENNGSIQKVSVQMNVHRNTINYKMKTIRENFNLKFDYEDIARLWLALTIKDMIDK